MPDGVLYILKLRHIVQRRRYEHRRHPMYRIATPQTELFEILLEYP